MVMLDLPDKLSPPKRHCGRAVDKSKVKTLKNNQTTKYQS